MTSTAHKNMACVRQMGCLKKNEKALLSNSYKQFLLISVSFNTLCGMLCKSKCLCIARQQVTGTCQFMCYTAVAGSFCTHRTGTQYIYQPVSHVSAGCIHMDTVWCLVGNR